MWATATAQLFQARVLNLTLTDILFLSSTSFCLVYTLERRNGLALRLIQRRGDDATVRQVDLAVGGLLEGECVLHPFLVITFGEVLAGMGTTRLLAGSGGSGGLGTKKSSCQSNFN